MFGGFGRNAEIRKGAYLVYTENIFIGDNVIVRPGCQFYADEESEIYINFNVLIGPSVHIYVNNHKVLDGKISSIEHESKPVFIGSGSWIGAGSILLAGTTIGQDCIVGAGSVVTGSHIPDGEVWAGNPARRIDVKSEREPDEIQGQKVVVRYSRKGRLQRSKRQEYTSTVRTTPDILGDQSS